MSTPEAEARRWLAYSRSDLAAAEELLQKPENYPRQVCFLAQQAAEKALKAALVFADISVPRSHDLDALRNLLPEGWQVKSEQPDLASLSVWAVEARYYTSAEISPRFVMLSRAKHLAAGHETLRFAQSDNPRRTSAGLYYPGDAPEAVETDARTAAQQARAVWESVCAHLTQRGLDTSP